MTEETKEETKEETLSVDDKIHRIGEIVFENNRILNSMLAALNQRPPAAGPPYPTGYPNAPAPPAPSTPAPGGTVPLSTAAPTAPAAFSNTYSEDREYIGAEEQHRTSRTYTDMGNLAPDRAQAAGPPPPDAPQPPPTTDERTVRRPPAASDGAERIMTPDEYRNENPE